MSKTTVYKCDNCGEESSSPLEVPGWIGLEVKDAYYASNEGGWIHIKEGDLDFCAFRCFNVWSSHNLKE